MNDKDVRDLAKALDEFKGEVKPNVVLASHVMADHGPKIPGLVELIILVSSTGEDSELPHVFIPLHAAKALRMRLDELLSRAEGQS